MTMLANRNAEQIIWPFAPQQFRHLYEQAVAMTRLGHIVQHPYCLRHGGASHDMLTKERSLQEIKNRGRWRSDAPLRRYQKAARALQQEQRMDQNMREYGQWVSANLEELFHHPGRAH